MIISTRDCPLSLSRSVNKPVVMLDQQKNWIKRAETEPVMMCKDFYYPQIFPSTNIFIAELQLCIEVKHAITKLVKNRLNNVFSKTDLLDWIEMNMDQCWTILVIANKAMMTFNDLCWILQCSVNEVNMQKLSKGHMCKEWTGNNSL